MPRCDLDKQMGPLTDNIRNRRLSRGLSIFKIVYGFSPPRSPEGDLALMNWIRMSSWWVRSGAMTPSSIYAWSRDWSKRVLLPKSSEFWTIEGDENVRRFFSDDLSRHVKARRDQLGDQDPQRIYKKKMRDRAKRQAFMRKELSQEAIRTHRCPICRKKVEEDLTDVRRSGKYLLPDCCGYGGLYTLVTAPPRKSYFRQTMTWDEWEMMNVKQEG